MIEYTLIRSKRNTIAVYIRSGIVEVRAPIRVAKCDIDKFVIKKEKQIKKILARSQEQTDKRNSFSLAYGDNVLYRGRQYQLSENPDNQLSFDGEKFLLPSLEPKQIKSACVQLYRVLAKHVLTEKTFHFAKLMGVAPAAVKINSAVTRWGSCSIKKSINFTWQLIMADDDVIDYVVVHELAHIKEMNHSPQFWAVVKDILPDYKKRQLKLKELQKRLINEDWGE
jgi:predicted metal-dependent hydrolase